MNFLKFIFIVLTCFHLAAQTGDINDSIYKIAHQSLYNDIDKSEELTKFLLKHSSGEIQKKSVLNKVKIEHLKGDYLEGIQSLYELSKQKSDDLNPFILMEIAQFYQSLGLSTYAQIQIDSVKQTSLPSYYLYKSEIESNTQIKIKLLHKGLNLIKQNPENIPYLKEQYYLELGENYKQSDSAIYYYNLVLTSLQNHKGNLLYNKALIELNSITFGKTKAININKLLALNQDQTDFESKRKLNQLFIKYYYSQNDLEHYKLSVKELQRLDSISDNNSIKARNFVISNANQEAKQNSTYRLFFLIVFSTLVFAGILMYFRLISIRKRTKIQLDNFRKEKFYDLSEEQNNKTITPEKTELELLKKLKEFEVSGKYLDKQISLPNLAEHLDTNIRYLSEIINKNKNKNFNQYVNELRINYIIQKMKTEPKYLNYKIQALADECGFSSLSVFSVTFKSIMGISPTVYAKNIKDKNND